MQYEVPVLATGSTSTRCKAHLSHKRILTTRVQVHLQYRNLHDSFSRVENIVELRFNILGLHNT